VRELVAVGDDTPLAIVRDPLRMILFVLTVLTISRVHLHFPVIAAARPVLLLSVAAICYAYLNPRQLAATNVMRLWPMRVMAILVVLACFSAAFGISLGRSASFILDSFSKTVTLAFLIALSIRNARDLYTYVWALVLSSGILALFSLFVFGLSTGNGLARLGDLYTYDSNDLGVLMMIGLPLTLLLLLVDRGFKRLLLVLILAGISAAMARSGSRGGFLGLVAVALAALFLVDGVSTVRRASILAAAVLALAAAAPSGYWAQMGTILSPKDDYNYSSDEGRTALIKRGLGYMAKYPVFGVGINNFVRAECTISAKVAARRHNGPLRCSAPHNSFVQAGAELGVPGFIAWVSLLFGAIVAPLRRRRRLPRSWRHGTPGERFIYAATGFFPVALIGFAVTSFFVTFAFSDPIYLMGAVVTGLYVSIAAQAAGNGAQPTRQSGPPRRERSVPGWRTWRSARSQRAAVLAR